MTTIFTIYSAASIIASIIALYVLIFGSLEKKEKENETTKQKILKRESSTIKIANSYSDQFSKNKGINTQVSSLLWTVAVGQAVGLYFLLVFLHNVNTVHTILRLNALILLLASFICSILTLINGWLKKKMEISFRLSFQGYSLAVALMLFKIGIGKGVSVKEAIIKAGSLPNVIISVFFSTVIMALLFMLIDGVYRKHERVDFNFNIYYLIVVGVGMGVGLLLLFGLSILNKG